MARRRGRYWWAVFHWDSPEQLLKDAQAYSDPAIYLQLEYVKRYLRMPNFRYPSKTEARDWLRQLRAEVKKKKQAANQQPAS